MVYDDATVEPSVLGRLALTVSLYGVRFLFFRCPSLHSSSVMAKEAGADELKVRKQKTKVACVLLCSLFFLEQGKKRIWMRLRAIVCATQGMSIIVNNSLK